MAKCPLCGKGTMKSAGKIKPFTKKGRKRKTIKVTYCPKCGYRTI